MATKLNIRIKGNADATKPQQIAQQIRAAVEGGRLKPGENLPSERALSEQLGVNRKTVRAAFAHLADERLIETSSTSNR
ncbi:MAG: GntR family transcriptional regulator, partial [Pyrinomonadaceae bacterium]